MHRILERQMRRIYGGEESFPTGIDDLVAAVSDAYKGFEDSNMILERTLNISSTELTEINKKLRTEKSQAEAKVIDATKELTERITELNQVNKAMVGRELKMIALKEEVEELKRELSGR